MGGIVAWIGLALTYLMLLRASEFFAEDDGSVHVVYCLGGGDVVFYPGERQVEGGRSPRVDTVEVRLRVPEAKRGSTGDDEMRHD